MVYFSLSVELTLGRLLGESGGGWHRRLPNPICSLFGACRHPWIHFAARAADTPTGGWLTPNKALAAWVELVAPADSRPERVAWERAKLRAQLSRAGVAGLDALYEVRREGDTVRTRARSFTLTMEDGCLVSVGLA
jgi:hypothetical protein